MSAHVWVSTRQHTSAVQVGTTLRHYSYDITVMNQRLSIWWSITVWPRGTLLLRDLFQKWHCINFCFFFSFSELLWHLNGILKWSPSFLISFFVLGARGYVPSSHFLVIFMNGTLMPILCPMYAKEFRCERGLIEFLMPLLQPSVSLGSPGISISNKLISLVFVSARVDCKPSCKCKPRCNLELVPTPPHHHNVSWSVEKPPWGIGEVFANSMGSWICTRQQTQVG